MTLPEYTKVIPFVGEGERSFASWAVGGDEPLRPGHEYGFIYSNREEAERMSDQLNARRYVAACHRHHAIHGVWPPESVIPRPSKSSK